MTRTERRAFYVELSDLAFEISDALRSASGEYGYLGIVGGRERESAKRNAREYVRRAKKLFDLNFERLIASKMP